MKRTDSPTNAPAPEPVASIDTVFGVATAVTAALVVPFVVATYPALLVVTVPIVAAVLAG